MRVLVTGSRGLIGSALCAELCRAGITFVPFDLKDGTGDVRNAIAVRRAVQNVEGVVHLAAIPRVEQCERDPSACWDTNVNGTKNILNALHEDQWLLFASSREVYGDVVFASGTEEKKPINVYGCAKAVCERLIENISSESMIIRFSNVYGSIDDHETRVIPAFVRAAVEGFPLHVEGSNNVFDFVHIEDVVRGLMTLVQNPVHTTLQLTTGIGTSLLDLASLCVELAKSDSQIVVTDPRSFDVHRFVGKTEIAQSEIRWNPKVRLREGLLRMILELGDRMEEERYGT